MNKLKEIFYNLPSFVQSFVVMIMIAASLCISGVFIAWAINSTFGLPMLVLIFLWFIVHRAMFNKSTNEEDYYE